MKKTHRFIGPYDLQSKEIVLDDAAARQIGVVLRMKKGERVLLCDGKDKEAEYEIVGAGFKPAPTVRVRRLEEPRSVHRAPRTVILYAAILKRENFEWAVQKAVECGVSRIVPMVTQRTIKKDVKRERLQEIAKEAAEQSGRGIVPEVSEPMSFEDALEDAKENNMNMFLDVGATRRVAPTGDRVGLFVGPEGGWDEGEVAMAKKAGFTIASLGPRVLRGETAVTVATFLAAS